MTLAIILTAMICGTIAFVVIVLHSSGRDYAARDRDRGLAKLYEARAALLRIEELERRAALYQQSEEQARREGERARRHREEACEEARLSEED